jgi:CIC family chloride channel protein
VIDADHTLLGVVTMAELGQLARDQPQLSGLLIAADVAGPTETVTPADSLLEATRRLGTRGASALPVVDQPGGDRLIGMLTRSHILAAYERALTSGH